MPYLNWKTAETRPPGGFSQEVGAHPRREHQLKLELSRPALEELIPQLEEALGEVGNELRLDLPGEWIIFWKARDTESRLLIAHPQPNEWVATAALEPAHGARVLSALRELKEGDSLPLSRGGTLGGVTNVEIIISLVA